MITLFVDEKEIFLNEFIQRIFTSLNLSCFNNLRGTPEKGFIKKFELQIDPEAKLGITLHINGKHIRNKPIIQDIIRGFNLGIIKALREIPQKVKKFRLTYQKTEKE
ncbi:MAG: hypothetical protein ACTSWY_14885 [Promethearchaeota archaeon]